MAAVFFDIDGTLWGTDNRIPESTKTALRLLKQEGHQIFICSGRTRVFIPLKQLQPFGFDGILSGCGTHIEYHGEELLYKKLDDALVKRSVQIFQDYHMIMILEGKEKLYMDRERIGEERYQRFQSGFLAGKIEPVSFSVLRKPDPAAHPEVSKCSLLIEGTRYREVMEILKEDYSFLIHGPAVMEAVPKGYSKATAIHEICSRLGIAREDTYAFGDSVNDLEMLQYAGCGIAMGNAKPEVRSRADYVTQDYREDGIYHACRHFGLIE